MKSARKDKAAAKAAEEPGNASKPVSLAPLTFDEALDGLLAVKPEQKPEQKKTTKRATKKKR